MNQDDLQKGVEEAVKELESTINKKEPVEEPTEEVIEQEKQSEEVEEESTEESKEEPKEQPQEDYKKRYVESTREAQVLYAKNKKLSEAIDKASLIEEPTEDELSKKYHNWDVLDDATREVLKETYISNKRFEIIHQAAQEGKDLQIWNEKVDTFISDPKTMISAPELEGKEEEFKVFCSKPTRRGVDFEDLVSAFLHSVEKDIKPKKGSMFETGTSTVDKKPKDDKISIEESDRIRRTDYKKYKELLISGKITTEI